MKKNILNLVLDNNMKSVALFFGISFLISLSCSEKETEKLEQTKSNTYYYIRTSKFRGGRMDIIKNKRFYHDNYHDTLVDQFSFFLDGENHTIRKYKRKRHVDSGHASYELDTFGIISTSSLSNDFYQYLYSTNEEINQLFRIAFSKIVFENEQYLELYQSRLPSPVTKQEKEWREW